MLLCQFCCSTASLLDDTVRHRRRVDSTSHRLDASHADLLVCPPPVRPFKRGCRRRCVPRRCFVVGLPRRRRRTKLADTRRQRRSLTEDDVARLLYVAQLRPLGPSLPLVEKKSEAATGTDGKPDARKLAPMLVPTTDVSVFSGSFPVNADADNADPRNAKTTEKTSIFPAFPAERATRLELATSSLEG